ncbi:hypothetical protein KSF78_0008852 [Schistosoma japonicum]|nr:hypothetical protein KSF78_0008852 [Schistosoma japonicum]
MKLMYIKVAYKLLLMILVIAGCIQSMVYGAQYLERTFTYNNVTPPGIPKQWAEEFDKNGRETHK